MALALLLRFRPAGPWRIGGQTGARDRVDRIYHSDTLYSAVSGAMIQLGWQDEWFAATAQSITGAAVKLTSLFPSLGNDLLVPAPAPLWPPQTTTRIRAVGAKFIPAKVVASLAAGEPWKDEDWEVDGLSECLTRRSRRGGLGPYRIALRSQAAVDRLDNGAIAVHHTACLEFAPGAGLWCAAEFASDEARSNWASRVESCFRLLGDSGLGGERSNGWGHFSIDKIEAGELRDLIFGVSNKTKPASPAEESSESGTPAPQGETGYWLLSLFRPADGDQVDWTRGTYAFLERGGRVESAAGWGTEKKNLRMVTEGSVLLAAVAPEGSAPDVAPDGFAHPVYRSGFAVSITIPWRVNA